MYHKKDAPGKGGRIADMCPLCYMYHERLWCLEIESWMKSLSMAANRKKKREVLPLPFGEK